MKFLMVLFVSLFGVVGAVTASLSAHDGWIRAAPPVAQVRAGYLVIENASAADIVLTKVESPDFGAIEIHTMYDDAGIMRMRRVPELHVPANGKVELKPGGLHLMMFRPQRALAEGDQVDVVLSGDAGAVATTLVVKAATP
ncbi:MAG: copper chaperone PCu(A)C [Rhodanobacteraceae bacterium]|jgi:copper(I)-binding protein|nr:copper chaperone PCu(A)C [Rhodanobacteraceae bacterium]MBK7044074.1 copper chaperone PCu(A)C [Rhodanobacteraceae bacterium]MBP9154925.1 copper chaperone PCu(A)C [Xanthomonadales bacterium]HQW81740.1 copper chaperone PCu(A)C [Pseudomonadota bacterium]